MNNKIATLKSLLSIGVSTVVSAVLLLSIVPNNVYKPDIPQNLLAAMLSLVNYIIIRKSENISMISNIALDYSALIFFIYLLPLSIYILTVLWFYTVAFIEFIFH
jgi:hypothetical protein